MIRLAFSLLLLGCIVLGAPRPASADTVLMADGTMHYGEIIEETATEVVIKTKIANIVTTLRLNRAEVAEIDRPDFGVKDEFWTKREGGDEALNQAAGPSEYLLIPIKGTIGREATADGVAAALREAKSRSIRHIVFEIDTPGGLVSDAERMSELIETHRASAPEESPVTFHAYVRNAISAGIWVLFACDRVYWAEGASAGGALAYSRDRSTGAAEVDAKMNSIIAAKMAASAERLGHPKALVRAMIQPEASAYAWQTQDGRTVISDTAPRPDTSIKWARTLDGPQGILTLTTSDAIEIGFGRLVSIGPAGIGTPAGIAGWASAGDGGVELMARAGAAAKKEAEQEKNQQQTAIAIAQEFERTLAQLIKQAESAEALHPLKGKYRIDRDGNFTPASRALWKANSNAAMDAWEKVLDGIDELRRLDGRFQRITGESMISKVGRKLVEQEIRDTVKWIKGRKNASRL